MGFFDPIPTSTSIGRMSTCWSGRLHHFSNDTIVLSMFYCPNIILLSILPSKRQLPLLHNVVIVTPLHEVPRQHEWSLLHLKGWKCPWKHNKTVTKTLCPFLASYMSYEWKSSDYQLTSWSSGLKRRATKTNNCWQKEWRMRRGKERGRKRRRRRRNL